MQAETVFIYQVPTSAELHKWAKVTINIHVPRELCFDQQQLNSIQKTTARCPLTLSRRSYCPDIQVFL